MEKKKNIKSDETLSKLESDKRILGVLEPFSFMHGTVLAIFCLWDLLRQSHLPSQGNNMGFLDDVEPFLFWGKFGGS